MRYARRGYPIGCEYGPEGETVDIGAERRPGWGRGEVNQKKKREPQSMARENRGGQLRVVRQRGAPRRVWKRRSGGRMSGAEGKRAVRSSRSRARRTTEGGGSGQYVPR